MRSLLSPNLSLPSPQPSLASLLSLLSRIWSLSCPRGVTVCDKEGEAAPLPVKPHMAFSEMGLEAEG